MSCTYMFLNIVDDGGREGPRFLHVLQLIAHFVAFRQALYKVLLVFQYTEPHVYLDLRLYRPSTRAESFFTRQLGDIFHSVLLIVPHRLSLADWQNIP